MWPLWVRVSLCFLDGWLGCNKFAYEHLGRFCTVLFACLMQEENDPELGLPLGHVLQCIGFLGTKEKPPIFHACHFFHCLVEHFFHTKEGKN